MALYDYSVGLTLYVASAHLWELVMTIYTYEKEWSIHMNKYYDACCAIYRRSRYVKLTRK